MKQEQDSLTQEQVLLRATYQLLKQQEESPIVLNILGSSTIWDGVRCDGYCLMEEIEWCLEGQDVDPNWVGEDKNL